MAITIDGDSGVSGVNGSATTPALQGTDSNTGIVFGTDTVQVSTGGSTRATVDSSGRLLVGTSTARANFFNSTDSAQFQIEGTDSNNSALSITRNSNSSGYAPLHFAKSRGTSVGSNTIVQSGDFLGGVVFSGSDGSEFVQAASIHSEVDGTPGSNDMPGRLTFHTTADGASSSTERVKIDRNGDIFAPTVYADTTASGANMHVTSGGLFQRSTSSAKYKKDIETLQDSYADALLQCRPVWYKSTCEQDNSAWGWWGFIAEEVAEIDPRLVQWKTTEVTYDEKGSAVQTPCEPEPEGVAYDRFVPHLLNLVKRQQAAIETLEAKVAALEAA